MAKNKTISEIASAMAKHRHKIKPKPRSYYVELQKKSVEARKRNKQKEETSFNTRKKMAEILDGSIQHFFDSKE